MSIIDFRNVGLEGETYEMLPNTYLLVKSDEIPHFITNKQDDEKMECRFGKI